MVKLGKEFEQLAVNPVPRGREAFSATRAVADGALFIRSDKSLYRISTTK